MSVGPRIAKSDCTYIARRSNDIKNGFAYNITFNAQYLIRFNIELNFLKNSNI